MLNTVKVSSVNCKQPMLIKGYSCIFWQGKLKWAALFVRSNQFKEEITVHFLLNSSLHKTP